MQARLPILLLTTAIACAGGHAAAAAPAPAADPAAINAAMTDIGAIMSNLVSEKVLAEPASAASWVAQLDSRFRSLEGHIGERGPAFGVTWQTMMGQIGLARQSIGSGEATADTLRNLVHGIASVCAGCHTQDGRAQALSFGKLKPAGNDPLQQARFAYITRNYADALRLYDAYLDSLPRVTYTGPVVDALEGELTIYAQVYRDAEGGAAHFRRQLEKRGSMSEQARRDMQSWVAGFDEIRRQKLVALQPDFATLEGYVQKYILPHEAGTLVTSEQEKVLYLWLRGLLHEYVQAKPQDPRMPELLYWLSLADRVLDYNLYYSLADLYLKECITRFPGSETAPLCLDEYERFTQLSYSGSAGIYMPQDVKDELARLQRLVDEAQKPAQPTETREAPPAAP